MTNDFIQRVNRRLGSVSTIAAELAAQRETSMRRQSVEEHRISQSNFAEVRGIPMFMQVEQQEVAGVPCELISHRVLNKFDISNNLIIYIHGGSWIFGDLDTARPVAPMLIKETGFKVLTIDYRKAPEDKYPKGFNDVYTVYNYVINSGVPSEKIAIFGDSAGGNYALALINKLKEEGKPLPKCLALASPVTDMRDTSELVSRKEDLIYTRHNDKEEEIFRLYLGDEYYDKRDLPTISPITADLSGLPPVLIHAGSAESISEDNIRYAEKMYKSGGDIKLKIWKDMFHDFTIVGSTLRESRESLKEIGDFFRSHLLGGK